MFFEKAKAVSAVLSSAKSEKEMDAAMKVLGFQKHDDAPCNRPWCIERYGCVVVTLIEVLRDIAENFFDMTLVPEEQLLSDDEIGQCLQHGCHALPSEWFTEHAKRYTVFRWFINLIDALEWNERRVPFASLAKDPVESAFVRESYLFTLSELRGYRWKQEFEGKRLIKGFLRENDLLRSEDTMLLLKEFEGLSSGKEKAS